MHVLLEGLDILRKGDEYWCSGSWEPIHDTLHGQRGFDAKDPETYNWQQIRRELVGREAVEYALDHEQLKDNDGIPVVAELFYVCNCGRVTPANDRCALCWAKPDAQPRASVSAVIAELLKGCQCIK